MSRVGHPILPGRRTAVSGRERVRQWKLWNSAAAAAVGGSTGKEILALGLNVTSDDLDLNKVSEYELNRAKECMDYKFKANQLKPGDPGYEYDLQVDFPPGMQGNDWDEDSDVDDGEDAEYEPEVDWNEIHSKVKRS
mmetsp:Transcript_26310/g.48226  ORF Transcript_26310/g.48226 Transcript_26310/m.48226 type:complete len:137 (+) Transcript_26310:754-1164(+)